MKIVICDQYSDSWWAARRGVPTASEFGCILTAKTMKLAAAAEGYIARLIGDLHDPEYPRIDRATSEAMRRGTEMEPEARRFYVMEADAEVRQVGFCLSDCGRFGCSSDALVGDDGVLELKNPLPHTQVQYLLDGKVPDDYLAQVHGHLIVTGRAYCDFMAYSPGLPHMLVRTTPNDYTAALREALELFHKRYEETKQRIEAIQ